jgi:hypothetical protein
VCVVHTSQYVERKWNENVTRYLSHTHTLVTIQREDYNHSLALASPPSPTFTTTLPMDFPPCRCSTAAGTASKPTNVVGSISTL